MEGMGFAFTFISKLHDNGISNLATENIGKYSRCYDHLILNLNNKFILHSTLKYTYICMHIMHFFYWFASTVQYFFDFPDSVE